MANNLLPVFECSDPKGVLNPKTEKYFSPCCSYYKEGCVIGRCHSAYSIDMVFPDLYVCRNDEAHKEFQNSRDDFLDRCYGNSED